jgi:hypothetical protein
MIYAILFMGLLIHLLEGGMNKHFIRNIFFIGLACITFLFGSSSAIPPADVQPQKLQFSNGFYAPLLACEDACNTAYDACIAASPGDLQCSADLASCLAACPVDPPVPTNTPVTPPTLVPSDTPVPPPTDTPTDVPIPTNTPIDIPTLTPTDIPTHTPTDIPTNTPIPTSTRTSTRTSTPTKTPTFTKTQEPAAKTATELFFRDHTRTPTSSNTPTSTITPTPTSFLMASFTPRPTFTPSQTSTPRPTRTSTPVPLPVSENTGIDPGSAFGLAFILIGTGGIGWLAISSMRRKRLRGW